VLAEVDPTSKNTEPPAPPVEDPVWKEIEPELLEDTPEELPAPVCNSKNPEDPADSTFADTIEMLPVPPEPLEPENNAKEPDTFDDALPATKRILAPLPAVVDPVAKLIDPDAPKEETPVASTTEPELPEALPVLRNTPPDTPTDSTFDDRTEMLPEPPPPLEPEIRNTEPPAEDAFPSPADISTLLPVLEKLVPTRRLIEPLVPFVAAPVAIHTEPEFPDNEDPEEISREPVKPSMKALPVVMEILPDPALSLAPDNN